MEPLRNVRTAAQEIDTPEDFFNAFTASLSLGGSLAAFFAAPNPITGIAAFGSLVNLVKLFTSNENNVEIQNEFNMIHLELGAIKHAPYAPYSSAY